jgi:protein-tyrosine phosphatase
MSTLPSPRDPAGPYRVAPECLGNICRSPMADVVLSDRVAAAGLDVEVVSAGTGNWHAGGSMDDRAAATLTGAGYDASRHRARTFDADWHDAVDLVLVMDAANLRDVGGPGERTRMFRDLDPVDPGSEVPDPYYGGAAGFEEVLRMVERTSASLVTALEQELCPR